MNEQASEKRQAPAWGRVLLVSVVALLVVGTGIVLIPRDSGTPPAVPFSETARTEALAGTLLLRRSADSLAAAADPGTDAKALGDAVTLLTTHARALQDPAASSDTSAPPSSAPPSSAETAGEPTRASFVAGLATSGRQRLDHAREADGGIARLLAAVGSAQLLEAEKLAAAWQLPVPSPTSGSPSGSTNTAPLPEAVQCPSVSPTAESTAATTDAALAATVRSEQEAVYVYQVALKRIDAEAAVSAARDLAVHEKLLQKAEALTRSNCGDVPAREAGYTLPTQFAEDPGAALGTLESDSLPGFGDLIALSEGETRDWAISGLLAAGRRSLAWGAPLPVLPGLELDADELPPWRRPVPARHDRQDS
ncbi:DUF4439 domain-containing protein [Paenarthrobacter sp. NPDC089322]|uniref:DUF4439 domain-containing protein n=1 Tax=Paenarthrobacter sp. NPDC089322 TaxID=3155065 RepID=UPI003422AA26